MARILSPKAQCPACGRLYRPNPCQNGACSTTCIEKMRQAQGLGTGGILVHESWLMGRRA